MLTTIVRASKWMIFESFAKNPLVLEMSGWEMHDWRKTLMIEMVTTNGASLII